MSHILLVEDVRDTREVTELILRDAGHRVTSGVDGLQSLSLAQQEQPDLILMDLAIPSMDGWEATRRLTTHPYTRHIPVVAFTAHATEDELGRARAAGCIEVILKPFDLTHLLTTIDAVLKSTLQSRCRRATPQPPP